MYSRRKGTVVGQMYSRRKGTVVGQMYSRRKGTVVGQMPLTPYLISLVRVDPVSAG